MSSDKFAFLENILLSLEIFGTNIVCMSVVCMSCIVIAAWRPCFVRGVGAKLEVVRQNFSLLAIL